jgi:hypothetical protein
MIGGYVRMSAQLADEVKRIAAQNDDDVRVVAEILSAYFRGVVDEHRDR